MKLIDADCQSCAWNQMFPPKYGEDSEYVLVLGGNPKHDLLVNSQEATYPLDLRWWLAPHPYVQSITVRAHHTPDLDLLSFACTSQCFLGVESQKAVFKSVI